MIKKNNLRACNINNNKKTKLRVRVLWALFDLGSPSLDCIFFLSVKGAPVWLDIRNGPMIRRPRIGRPCDFELCCRYGRTGLVSLVKTASRPCFLFQVSWAMSERHTRNQKKNWTACGYKNSPSNSLPVSFRVWRFEWNQSIHALLSI